MADVYDFPNANEQNVEAETPTFLEKILDELDEAEIAQGLEEIAVLLSLPDEQFEVIAPIYLIEMEKALNDPNNKVNLMSQLVGNGSDIDEIRDFYKKLMEEIDSDEYANVPAMQKDFIKRIISIVLNAINDGVGTSKRYIQIPIEICDPRAKIPTYANIGDAGLDIYALEDFTVAPGETKLIKTGLKVAIPKGYELQVRPKSGRSLKTKLRVANTPGTIDSGYRDEIGIIIENVEPPIKDMKYEAVLKNGRVDYLKLVSVEHGASFSIGAGEKFAQLVLSEVPTAVFLPVQSISDYAGDRGGGFGSSGVK